MRLGCNEKDIGYGTMKAASRSGLMRYFAIAALGLLAVTLSSCKRAPSASEAAAQARADDIYFANMAEAGKRADAAQAQARADREKGYDAAEDRRVRELSR